MSGLTRFLMEEVEMKMISIVAGMEDAGYGIDRAHFERLRDRLEPEREELLETIREAAGDDFNPASHYQVREYLYGSLKLEVKRRTKKGEPSTDDLTLQRASTEHEAVRAIIRYRELDKILGTYASIPDQADEDGRFRVSFNQLGAKTGRFISPSIIQTLPKADDFRIRHGFVAGEGRAIVGADFDQQELRVLAQCSGDEKMQAAFARDVDLHGLAAVKVFELDCDPGEVRAKFPEKRNQVKAIQFGLIYGASAYSLAETLRVEKVESQRLIDDYFKEFPKVKKFIENAHGRLMRDGHLDDVFGRRRSFLVVKRKLPKRKRWHQMNEQERKFGREVAAAKREGQNFLIQGASATITKLAMIRCHEHITAEHPGIKMLLTLHDELQFEVPEPLVPHFAGELPGLMCDLDLERFGFRVPMKVEVKTGPSWGELKKWQGV